MCLRIGVSVRRSCVHGVHLCRALVCVRCVPICCNKTTRCMYIHKSIYTRKRFFVHVNCCYPAHTCTCVYRTCVSIGEPSYTSPLSTRMLSATRSYSSSCLIVGYANELGNEIGHDGAVAFAPALTEMAALRTLKLYGKSRMAGKHGAY